MPTEEEIDAAMTSAGAWTRETLEGWGVPWPPPRGWRKALIAGEPVPDYPEGVKRRMARKAEKMAARPKRVRQPIANIEPICIECGELAEQVGGERIYPHRPDLHSKVFFLCPCGAYVGAHPGTTVPLGYPAGPATRKARNAAHAAFDPLWQRKAEKDGIGRGRARGLGYAWLATELGIAAQDCHISHMNAAMALRVVEVCKRRPAPQGEQP